MVKQELDIYATDLSAPGGYVQGHTFLDDDGFENFRAKKYKSYDVNAAPPEIDFDEPEKKPLSMLDQDREEFEKKKENFSKDSEHVGIWNTHVPLAWTMRNVDNEDARNNLRAAKGEITYEEADKMYNQNLSKAAAKYHVTPDDIKEWQSRDWKGFITGTTEVLNDMRDAYSQAGVGAAVVTSVSAGIGLVAGFFTPAGPAGGAVAGGKVGMEISGKTAIPLATFHDTTIKETGSFIKDYRLSHPNMTPEQERSMKVAALASGTITGMVEMGMAAYLMPYVGKVAMRIPGANKVVAPLVGKAEAESAKHLSKFLATSEGAQFLAETSKLIGLEIGTEEFQEAVKMVAEASTGDTITKEEVGSRLTKTAIGTIQGAGLLSAIGARAEVRSRGYSKAAESVNSKIEKVNTEYEMPGEKEIASSPTVLAGGIEKNVVAEIPTPELPKAHAEQTIKVKQIEGQLSLFQQQIENASDLGLGEKEVAQLETQVETLTQEKEQAVLQMREIGTERAIRQATQETETQIESTVAKIESVSEQITGIEEKIEAAKKEGADTSKLESKKSSIESKLQVLEGQHEDLLTTKTKLEAREDLDNVLKGKNTTIPSGTLVKIEKEAKTALTKKDEENKTKINKILEKNAKDKIKALFKEKQNSFVSGYKIGTKEQIKETKDINKEFTRALLGSGIKRSELGYFDTIRKGVVTNADFVAKRKQITAAISAVFEARNKEIALKMTDKLRKLSKPAKGGKKPLGKMTAEIQEKVDRLFAFTKKSAFEAGFDIDELRQKANVNPEETLTKTEKLKIIQAQNNERISTNQKIIETLSDTKQTPKTKWEGLNTEREDLIAPDKESVTENIKGIEIAEVEQTEANILKEEKAYDVLAKALNMINMGFKFKDLTLRMHESAFDRENQDSNRGYYDPNDRSINLKKDGPFALAHEVGHYFDQLLGDMLGLDGGLFSRNRTFADPALKKIYNKMSVILKAEAARTVKHERFNKMAKTDQQYIANDAEIFARIFDAMFYKVEKTTNERNDWQSILTENMPASTISSFKSVLNDLAQYKEVGQRVFELSEENAKLEADNKQASKSEAWIEKEAIDRQLPISTVELINELEMSADLKNKTSAEINAFNEYVAELIQEGRDAKKDKLEAKRARREAKIQEVFSKIEKLAPEKGVKGNITKSFIFYMNNLHAHWDMLLESFFGKDIGREFSILDETLERGNFVRIQKEEITNKMKDIFGVKREWQAREKIIGKLGEVETYIQNVGGVAIPVKLNKMQLVEAYIHMKSELGSARLLNMFGQEQIDKMFSPLNFSKEDREFGDLLQEYAESYYDAVNKVFEEERNISLPKESFFFPMRGKGKTKEKDMAFGGMTFIDGDPSMVFSRDQSPQVALVLGNPLTTLWNHIDAVGDYTRLAQPLNEINAIFNDERIIKQIENVYGRGFVSALQNKLTKMTIQERTAANIEPVKVLDKMISNTLVAKIALKGAIAVKQWVNLVAYADGMPVSSFLKYQAEFLKNPKKAIQFMAKDDYIQTRFKDGSLGVELAKAIEEAAFSRTGTFVEFSALNIRFGDIAAVVQGGYSKVQYLIKEKGLSETEAFKVLARDTAETQAYSSIDSISNLQAWGKTNAFARYIFAFKNSQNQFVRKIGSAIIQHSRGEISTRQLAKTIFIFQVLNPFVYTTATSLSVMAALLASDDEDKEEAWAKVGIDLAYSATFGNANALPLLGDNTERGAAYVAYGDKFKTPGIPFADTIGGMTFDTIDLVKSLMAEDVSIEDIEYEDFIKHVLEMGEIGTGLPLTTARNMAEGVGDIATTDNKIQGALRVEGYSKNKAKQFAAE